MPVLIVYTQVLILNGSVFNCDSNKGTFVRVGSSTVKFRRTHFWFGLWVFSRVATSRVNRVRIRGACGKYHNLIGLN
ncbi:hypothetical protein HanRHA438_Chr11g0530031 [Helianthus annuus]|nr:hypothetical protein HanRHA438_Chr11g0530031 [Helianthus annuus]